MLLRIPPGHAFCGSVSESMLPRFSLAHRTGHGTPSGGMYVLDSSLAGCGRVPPEIGSGVASKAVLELQFGVRPRFHPGISGQHAETLAAGVSGRQIFGF